MSISNIDKTREEVEKIKKLADAMYYAAQNLTTDASRLHKAMDEYHKFIIYEYHKEEPTIPEIVDEHFDEMLREEPVSEDFETALEKKVREAQDWTYIEEEGGECPLNEEFGADDLEEFARWGAEWVRNNEKEPVSKELTDEIKSWLKQWSENEMEWSREDIWDTAEHFANWQKQQDSISAKNLEELISTLSKRYPEVSFAKLSRIVVRVAKWQKQQMIKDAADGVITFDYYKDDKAYGCVAHDSFCLEERGLRDCDKVKIIVVKED